MVYNEGANVALEGHEGKGSGKIVVQNSSTKAAKQKISQSDDLLLGVN
jgi:hypothetical protein